MKYTTRILVALLIAFIGILMMVLLPPQDNWGMFLVAFGAVGAFKVRTNQMEDAIKQIKDIDFDMDTENIDRDIQMILYDTGIESEKHKL